jgi:hypothetical protein
MADATHSRDSHRCALPALAIIVGLLLGTVIAGTLLYGVYARGNPDFAVGPVGTLHSVMLANGQIYYGTLYGITGSAVVLDHVFYVEVSVDPKTNEHMNKLVSREKNDWHAPIRMVIPLDKVEFIEIVGRDSAVAKLIAGARQ